MKKTFWTAEIVLVVMVAVVTGVVGISHAGDECGKRCPAWNGCDHYDHCVGTSQQNCPNSDWRDNKGSPYLCLSDYGTKTCSYYGDYWLCAVYKKSMFTGVSCAKTTIETGSTIMWQSVSCS
jgi:hypothetical protein